MTYLTRWEDDEYPTPDEWFRLQQSAGLPMLLAVEDACSALDRLDFGGKTATLIRLATKQERRKSLELRERPNSKTQGYPSWIVALEGFGDLDAIYEEEPVMSKEQLAALAANIAAQMTETERKAALLGLAFRALGQIGPREVWCPAPDVVPYRGVPNA